MRQRTRRTRRSLTESTVPHAPSRQRKCGLYRWLLFTVLAALLLSSCTARDSLVEAERIVLKGAGGQTLATLGTDPAGDPTLVFYDKESNVRLSIGTGLGGPYVWLRSKDGSVRAGIDILADGWARFSLFNDTTGDRLFLQMFANGVMGLQFCSSGGCGENDEGYTRIVLAAARDGRSALTFSDSLGTARIQFYLVPDGSPELVVAGRDGSLLWSALR